MRAVLQRVKNAEVQVDEKIVGEVSRGWLVFLGIAKSDSLHDVDYLVDKILNLRVFPDEMGKFNHSVLDIKGELLVVSQFTLYGDCRKGRRPSFTEAADPETANHLYEMAITKLKQSGLKVATGIFQANMSVRLENDGPVTMLLDSNKKD
jgi:D-tyrosyl-tRNA(Tyr) deacylase